MISRVIVEIEIDHLAVAPMLLTASKATRRIRSVVIMDLITSLQHHPITLEFSTTSYCTLQGKGIVVTAGELEVYFLSSGNGHTGLQSCL